MNPTAITAAIALPIIIGAVIGWAIGRTMAVRATHAHRAGIAEGYRRAHVETEQTMSDLRGDLDHTEQQIVALVNQNRLSCEAYEQTRGGASWN